MNPILKNLASEISLENRISYAVKMFYAKQSNPKGTPFDKLSDEKEIEVRNLIASLNEVLYNWKKETERKC